MAHQGRGQAWGKLVKVDASPGSEILLINRECTVGRKKGALNIIINNVFDHVNCSMLSLVNNCLLLKGLLHYLRFSKTFSYDFQVLTFY